MEFQKLQDNNMKSSGGYCSGGQWGNTMKKRLRESEAAILPDAISVCDAFAPPDFLLHSMLGSSDGQIYQRLIQYFVQFPHEISPHNFPTN